MSYIYRIDGTLLKTNNIIEHMDICTIPEPCPLCDIVKEDNDKVSSKISEPYIIIRKMNETNILQIVEEYIGKLTQFNHEATSKYILYNNLVDLKNFNELIKTANLSYKMQDNLNSSLNKLSDVDKVEVIRNLFNNNNIKNIPPIKNVNDGIIIKVNFEPIVESFNQNIIENFNNYNISGSFSLIFIDLETENDQVYRYIVLSLSDNEKIAIKNTIIYNVPFEVSEKNNNIPPNPYDEDNVLKVMKLFLQKIFIKPNPENYIYYTKELRGCSSVTINFLTSERGMNDTSQENTSLEDAQNIAMNDITIWALEYNSQQKGGWVTFRTLKSDGTKPLHEFISSDQWSTYLKKDIVFEHPDYQRYQLSNEKSNAPEGNSFTIEGGYCQNTKTLQDAVILCNDTVGCESFFRYLPGSSGAQTDGSMRTCFKGYAYEDNDLDKSNSNTTDKGDMYVKKNKKQITILDEKSNDIENLRYGDFITINNKYPTDCGDDCTKEYQAYLDIFGENEDSQTGFGLWTSQINNRSGGGSCFEIIGKDLGKNGTIMNNDIVYLVSRGDVNAEDRTYNGGNISIYLPAGSTDNPSDSVCNLTDYGVGTKWQTGGQPDDTSEWMIQIIGDSNVEPIKNNAVVNFINPKTNSILATCNWKVESKQLGVGSRVDDGRAMTSSDFMWKLERTTKIRDRFVSHQLKTNNAGVCGIEGKIGTMEFWGWLNINNNIQWEGMKNLSGDFSCKGNWWRTFNKGSTANINDSKSWNKQWLGITGGGIAATAWDKLLPVTKKELDSQVKCVGQNNENTPYYYNDLYNPGCCDGVKPWLYNGINYCNPKPQILPEAPFGYETIKTNVKCDNWASNWVDSASEPQFGANTVEKCAETCNRNTRCNEFYFHPTSNNCWLATGFCSDVPSDQTHYKSLKSVKESLCYSNSSAARYIKENIDKIEYDEIETNKLIYQIQRTKNDSINNFNKYIKIHEFGDIIDIIIGFRFKVNNISFDIYDLKLDNYKIYRFLFI
jgi:hypothetical protein